MDRYCTMEKEVELEMIEEEKENIDIPKLFIWPDKAVLLLLEIYREKEDDFSSGMKRNNKIWAEIAAEMKEVNHEYELTGQQCSTKMSGLKRTYKHITDMNKKSGNHRSSWAFFSVMDSIFGNKACIRPVAIATSDGPSDPNMAEPSTSRLDPEPKGLPKKKWRTELVEEFIDHLTREKAERMQERERQEEAKERRREERQKRHDEQMEIQRSFVAMLERCLNKK